MTEVPWMWFVIRSSGLVAVGLLTVSVVLGLVGPRLRPGARLTSISVHRAAAVAGTLLIVGHIVLAVLDTWISLDWTAALVPGIAEWERWGIALGALGVDLMLIVLVTTATRLRAPRLWRRSHLLAYPVWAVSVGHGLLVGTDGAAMRAVAMVCTAVVLFAVAGRILVRPRITPAARPGLVGAGVVP